MNALVEEQGYTGDYSVVQRYRKVPLPFRQKKQTLNWYGIPDPPVLILETDFHEVKLIREEISYLIIPFTATMDTVRSRR